MTTQFSEHPTRLTEPLERPGTAWPAIDWRAIGNASRACCCPAKPVVVAVMPPAAGRDHPTELLLCGHHYRVSRAALGTASAAVFDHRARPPVIQRPRPRP